MAPEIPVVPPALQASVLEWYAATGRKLAFRGTTDPYAILVAESLAQQTQVARAAAAWHGFLAAFPNFAALAAASPAAVLRAWRGLGYYRRALAIRRVARIVMAEHDGRLPETVDALERLPGIGPYTARAVAALAFGRVVGPVDTNVRRILSRAMFGQEPSRITQDSAGSSIAGEDAAGRAELQRLADAAAPAGRAGEWAHALMDVGALVCRPRAPRCPACPLQPWCRWAAMPRPAVDRGPLASRRVAEPSVAFPSTNRWLRGRILERLCDAPDGAWVNLGQGIGSHGPAALSGALERMRREGLAELHPTTERSARLPLS